MNDPEKLSRPLNLKTWAEKLRLNEEPSALSDETHPLRLAVPALSDQGIYVVEENGKITVEAGLFSRGLFAAFLCALGILSATAFLATVQPATSSPYAWAGFATEISLAVLLVILVKQSGSRSYLLLEMLICAMSVWPLLGWPKEPGVPETTSLAVLCLLGPFSVLYLLLNAGRRRLILDAKEKIARVETIYFGRTSSVSEAKIGVPEKITVQNPERGVSNFFFFRIEPGNFLIRPRDMIELQAQVVALVRFQFITTGKLALPEQG